MARLKRRVTTKRRMTRGVFVSAFFILFATLFCWTEGADVTLSEQKKTLFKGDKMEKPLELSGELAGKDKNFLFSFPALFEVDGAVVAMADARLNSDGKNYVGIAAAVMDKKGKWGKISAIWQDYSDTQDFPLLLNPTVIVTEDNSVSVIFAGHGCQKDSLGKIAADVQLELLMASGNIGDETKETDIHEGAKYFNWQSKIVPVTNGFPADKKEAFEKQLSQKYLNHFIGGKSIQLKDDKYVFPVRGVTANYDNVFFISSPENEDDWKFLSQTTVFKNCFDPVIINWTENKDFMITPCDNGNYRVFEISSEGKWDLYGGMLSGVWGSNKERKGPGIRAGFTSAEIDGRTVAFFTQPMQKEKGENDYQLHLWLTDMNHTYDIGQISGETENVRASTLLYKKGGDEGKDKLYCLYEVDKEGKRDIVFVDLTRGLERVKEVLREWEEVDKKLLTLLCPSEDSVSTKDCPNADLTKDLVSYFTNKSTNKGTWEDDYLHMNATIKGGEKVPNGLRFSGAGAGAKWDINTGKQNRPYHFANYDFTLVATVTIHKKPKTKRVPLLGVTFNENGKTRQAGLWYTDKQTWSVKGEPNEDTGRNSKWEIGEPYQVAMSFKNQEHILYVNGSPFEDYEEEEDDDVEPKKVLDILHIYIGDYSTSSTFFDATVTNVFLYVRQSNQEFLDTLRKITTVSTKPAEERRDSIPAAENFQVKKIEKPGHANSESITAELGSPAQSTPLPQQSVLQQQAHSKDGYLRDTQRHKNHEESEMSAVSVREESVADSSTVAQSQGEIADGSQDNLSQIDVAERNVQGEENNEQIDGEEDKLQLEAQGENTTLAPSSTPIPPVAGSDTQSAAPAAQPHGNATRVNISSIAEMFGKSGGGGGDGTVRERISLVLLLMGFMAFLAAPH